MCPARLNMLNGSGRLTGQSSFLWFRFIIGCYSERILDSRMEIIWSCPNCSLSTWLPNLRSANLICRDIGVLREISNSVDAQDYTVYVDYDCSSDTYYETFYTSIEKNPGSPYRVRSWIRRWGSFYENQSASFPFSTSILKSSVLNIIPNTIFIF